MRSTRREGVREEGHWLCTYGWDKDCGYNVTSHSVEMGVVYNASRLILINVTWLPTIQLHRPMVMQLQLVLRWSPIVLPSAITLDTLVSTAASLT